MDPKPAYTTSPDASPPIFSAHFCFLVVDPHALRPIPRRETKSVPRNSEKGVQTADEPSRTAHRPARPCPEPTKARYTRRTSLGRAFHPPAPGPGSPRQAVPGRGRAWGWRCRGWWCLALAVPGAGGARGWRCVGLTAPPVPPPVPARPHRPRPPRRSPPAPAAADSRPGTSRPERPVATPAATGSAHRGHLRILGT